MGGLVLDIYLEWLIRMLIKLVRRGGSRTWPTATAVVDAATKCDSISVGLTLISVTYTYTANDEEFDGRHKEPFILSGLAEDYIRLFPARSETPIRINPANPRKTFLIRG